MKPSVRFSAACSLAELWLERGEKEAAAQLLRDIEPLMPKDNQTTGLEYVKLLQQAGCQVHAKLSITVGAASSCAECEHDRSAMASPPGVCWHCQLPAVCAEWLAT